MCTVTQDTSAQNTEPGTPTSLSRDYLTISPYLGSIETMLWNPIGYGVQELMQYYQGPSAQKLIACLDFLAMAPSIVGSLDHSEESHVVFTCSVQTARNSLPDPWKAEEEAIRRLVRKRSKGDVLGTRIPGRTQRNLLWGRFAGLVAVRIIINPYYSAMAAWEACMNSFRVR